MKHFHIVKDAVGGKLVTTYDETRFINEVYYTNEELMLLYDVLGKLWINRAKRNSIK